MKSNLYLKNITNTEIILQGTALPPNEVKNISYTNLYNYVNDPELFSLISSNSIIVTDGFSEFSNEEALRYVKTLKPISVITRYERDDRTLRACSAQSDINPDTGIAVIEIDVPPTNDRTIAGGESWFHDKHKDDRIIKAEIFTRGEIPPGVFGPDPVPAGTTLQHYHDIDLPEDQQGFRIPFTRGVKEIRTIAGYGVIPAGLSLRVVGKKGGNPPFAGTFYINIEWGIKNYD